MVVGKGEGVAGRFSGREGLGGGGRLAGGVLGDRSMGIAPGAGERQGQRIVVVDQERAVQHRPRIGEHAMKTRGDVSQCAVGIEAHRRGTIGVNARKGFAPRMRAEVDHSIHCPVSLFPREHDHR